MTFYNYNSPEDFDSRWRDIRSDLRRNRVEVEWGRSSATRRRDRALEPEKKRSWLALAAIVLSLSVAVAIATFASINLMSVSARRESDPDEVVGLVSTRIPTRSPTMTNTTIPSELPSMEPSETPTLSNSHSPSIIASVYPSLMPSIFPSESPSFPPTAVQKAPPALNTTVECVNLMGVFYNHKNQHVGCDWFESQGAYGFIKNCGKTELGNACLLSCYDYNDCKMPPTHEPIVTSSPSDSPSLSPTKMIPKTVTLIAAADSSIKKDNPDVSLGSASYLKIDADSGTFHALIRFDLKGHDISRTVESALLRLKAASNCPFGGYFERTVHSNWNENTVTWANAPDGDGEEVARFQSISTGYWYSVDVTSALHHDKSHLSLRLFPISTNECLFLSKDHASGEGPELYIIYA
ncbi:hypothetical protein ACHAXS_009913 [Conticribra weissflogii]